MPADVVRMGSTVTFKSDDGHTRTLKLVYPAEESLDEHRISVMTPVGAALIGSASASRSRGRRATASTIELTVEQGAELSRYLISPALFGRNSESCGNRMISISPISSAAT